MKLHTQCLRLAQTYVPIIQRRFNVACGAGKGTPVPRKSFTLSYHPQPKQQGHKKPKNVKSKDIKPDEESNSELHWALGSGYKIGRSVPRAASAPQHLQKYSGIPGWDDRVLALKLHQSEGCRVISMPHFWLRDNCRCSNCVNQDTMQRAFDTFSIPKSVKPSKVVTEKNGLQITWEHDGHISLYPWDFIMKHQALQQFSEPDQVTNAYKEVNSYEYWGADIKASPPTVHYDEIMANDAGVGKWTAKIQKYGFCYVDGCPVSPEKTQELLERIAFIRTTHYGGFYDFTSDLTIKDTAYTTLALPAHTDTTYFTDPAGLQMFHLLSHTDGEGGKSLLVDGFKAAQILKEKSSQAFRALYKVGIAWHASGNEGITITPAKRFPVIGFGDVGDEKGQRLMQVRWNNDDRGVLSSSHGDKYWIEQWYEAARLWNEILKDKDMEYWAQLEPGRPLIFDNWRVLHGRSAFTGRRRVCGGYINHDDYISRWRNTNFSREEAIAQIL